MKNHREFLQGALEVLGAGDMRMAHPACTRRRKPLFPFAPDTSFDPELPVPRRTAEE